MSEQREPVGVIGVGWVGLVTAACFAELGHPVVARDIVQEKVDALSRGEVTIHEPGLADLLRRNAERLTFTTEMDGAAGGRPAALRLRRHAADLLRRRRPLARPGRCRGAARGRRPRADHEEHRAGRHRRGDPPRPAGPLLRLLPRVPQRGDAVTDFMHPDRVVVGADAVDDAAADAVAALYRPLGGELLRTDVASAEMIKLASNAFLATKISFINEIANVCEEVGADVGEVAQGMGFDERIGSSFLRAGIGYGGSCFPKDVTALKMLAGNTGYHFQLLTAVIEVNELQKRRVVGKLREAPRLADRQAGGAARPRLQARHRRHARGLEPRPRGAAAG